MHRFSPLLCLVLLFGCANEPTIVGTDGLTITAPPGALPDGVELGVQEVDVLPAVLPDGVELISGIYELTPHGVQFNAPVTIEIDFDAAQVDGDLGDLGVYSFDDLQPVDYIWESVSGGDFDALGTATVDVEHFSFFIVGLGEPDFGDDDDTAPDDDDASDDDDATPDDDDSVADDDDSVADDDDSVADDDDFTFDDDDDDDSAPADDDDATADDDDATADDDDSAPTDDDDATADDDDSAPTDDDDATADDDDSTPTDDDDATADDDDSTPTDDDDATADDDDSATSITWSGDLVLSDNNALADFCDSYERIAGNLHVNGSITALDMPCLIEVEGNIEVIASDLTSLTLNTLITVGGGLMLSDNASLDQLELGALESVGTVQISGNALNMLALPALLALEALFIDEEPQLTSIMSLGSATMMTGALQLGDPGTGPADEDLPNLISLDGLLNLQEVQGSVQFCGLAVTHFEPLPQLAVIGADLIICENSSLDTLTGLEVDTIGGSLDVVDNELLWDVDPLMQLLSIGGDALVTGNLILPVDTEADLLDYLLGITTGSVSVLDNG